MLRLVDHHNAEDLRAMFLESGQILAAQDTDWME
jgi:hypothetical protein